MKIGLAPIVDKYCKILILYCNYDSSIIFYKNNYKYVILLSHNKNKLDFIYLIWVHFR